MIRKIPVRATLMAALLCSVAFFVTAPAAIAAENSTENVSLTVGAAALVRPTYMGSDRYKVAPLPLVSMTYHDWLSAGPTGLSAYWHAGALKLGGGLTFSGKRTDKNSNNLFEQGDERLRGMGSINAAAGVDLFADYDAGFIDVQMKATKFLGSDNNGVTIDFNGTVPVALGQHLRLLPTAGLTWASNSYMQTFFGVTAAQAAASQFAAFKAESGIRDMHAGISAQYWFTRNWFVTAGTTMTYLANDAADSPLRYARGQMLTMAGVGYHF